MDRMAERFLLSSLASAKAENSVKCLLIISIGWLIYTPVVAYTKLCRVPHSDSQDCKLTALSKLISSPQ